MKTRPLRFIVARAVPTLNADAVVRADVEAPFVNATEGGLAVATKFGDDFLIDDRQTEFDRLRVDRRFARKNECFSVDAFANEFEDDAVVLEPINAALLELGGRFFDESALRFDAVRAVDFAVAPAEEVERPRQRVARFAVAERFEQNFERIVDETATGGVFAEPNPARLQRAFETIFKNDFLREEGRGRRGEKENER